MYRRAFRNEFLWILDCKSKLGFRGSDPVRRAETARPTQVLDLLRNCPRSRDLIWSKQMQPTHDLRVIGAQRLRTPRLLKEKLPMSERANQTVVDGRGGARRSCGRTGSACGVSGELDGASGWPDTTSG